MNVTKKTEVTYSLTDLTEQQAQDLLTLAAKASVSTPPEGMKGIYIPVEAGEFETLNNMRQTLLSAGLVRSEGVE